MDRLSQLRGEAGSSQDSSMVSTSPANETYLTANESPSKYYSMSEVGSDFDISSINDVSLTSTTEGPTEKTLTESESIISNLQPIGTKIDSSDTYKIGKQIEAANILSGGVNIFDNDNSYDGDELVIDDNTNVDGKSISGNVELDKPDSIESEGTLVENDSDIPSKDMEVVLQIDGKNVNAIDIGNGLYLYRQDGEEELAAVQIIDDDQSQPSFKFLKVRENAEGNLEVYEEIEVEIPNEVKDKEAGSGPVEKNISHVPIKDIKKIICEPASNKKVDDKNEISPNELKDTNSNKSETQFNQDSSIDLKPEINLNFKMKLNESRKSPVIGSFTHMTYHSTPNKEGIPLTKTMVDQQLHPNRQSDNIKKKIEVHTDSCKLRLLETPISPSKNNVSDKIDGSKVKLFIEEDEVKSDKKVLKDCKDVVFTKEDEKTQETPIPPENVLIDIDIVSKDKDSGDKKEILEKESDSIILQNENIAPKAEIKSDNKVEKSCVTTEDCNTITKSDTEPIVLVDKQAISDEKCQALEEVQKYSSTKVLKSVTGEPLKKNNEKDTEQKLDDIISKIETEHTIKDDKTSDQVSLKIDLKLQNVAQKVDVTLEESSKVIHEKCVKEQSTQDDPDEQNLCQPTNIEENVKFSLSSNDRNLLSSVISIKTNAEQTDHNLKINPVAAEDENDVQPSEKMIIFNEKPEKQSPKDVFSETKKTTQDKILNTKEAIEEKGLEIEKSKNDLDKGGNKDVSTKKIIDITKSKSQLQDINEKEKLTNTVDVKTKPINNNNQTAVPFGQWTSANRQEFLNKIKETKITTSNTNQIKQTNDLNRRDILKKFDTQRSNNAAAKSMEALLIKQNVKNETAAFVNKVIAAPEANIKKESSINKAKPLVNKKCIKQETASNTHTKSATTTAPLPLKKETIQRKEINNQDLIDKTIEGIINKAVSSKPTQEDTEQTTANKTKSSSDHHVVKVNIMDDIEMKMNELHGIPFIERPPHELPQANLRSDIKTYRKREAPNSMVDNKGIKIPKLLPLKNKTEQNSPNDNEVDTDEEVIEHVPITGDIDSNDKLSVEIIEKSTTDMILQQLTSDTKNDAIITENDFDKFARRNSISYENRLTFSFDGNEPHNVVQTVVEKDIPKTQHKNETNSETNKAPKKSCIPVSNVVKVPVAAQSKLTNDDNSNKNYQSKLQIAYQSLTAKRQMDSPITVIEDKPVKVVFMECNDFIPYQLNVQGKELTPTKKIIGESDTIAERTCDSVDSDMLDAIFEGTVRDESKSKTKHQRKQVLTPVDNPEIELIEPRDIGVDVSPKKKRKIEDKLDKSPKNVVHKKSYLLGRNPGPESNTVAPVDVKKSSYHESLNESLIDQESPSSAIDKLVKAAEIIENQSESIKSNTSESPVKRGRGRPRKYPLPDSSDVSTPIKEKNTISPKKPRLIDAKPKKHQSISSDDDDDSDGEIVKENWTMGKINEKIVCPICNKLFRSENVVFKHVKHCTGPSPNRSDSDKRSLRRYRESQDSEQRLRYSESSEEKIVEKEQHLKEEPKQTPVKSKRQESASKSITDDNEVIVIEDTPVKEKIVKVSNKDQTKPDLDKTVKTKFHSSVDKLMCEFCGKTFRQLSYLVSHKLKHKNDAPKKTQKPSVTVDKSVFSCETCKKDFRKLHHLIQHQTIHKPTSATSSRSSRMNSSDQTDNKVPKVNDSSKSEDQSAGFRCERCDKSFRKLHHLVEHRETHDGANRHKTSANAEKPISPPQCDICKKTFRKLHHLVEHKEQHMETSSDKSDDKSVKSCLSTRDIIHECSLCYMVFPNENSLTKHRIYCEKKKKQSAAKAKQTDTEVKSEEDSGKTEDSKVEKEDDEVELITDDQINIVESFPQEKKEPMVSENVKVEENKEKASQKETASEPVKELKTPLKRKSLEAENHNLKTSEETPEILKRIKENGVTPKAKVAAKSKLQSLVTVTKRHKTTPLPLPIISESTLPTECSDDDEVRYMLNPNFNGNVVQEEDFMKIRAAKRSSLQIERPQNKDSINRRKSIQHPPRIPRLKPKPVEPKEVLLNMTTHQKIITKPLKLEPVPFTDSDDSDIKYSFPKVSPSKTVKVKEAQKEVRKIPVRKSLTQKRQSLGSIAKRKSTGKLILSGPVKPPVVKRRAPAAEHRCDCGQLFSSAALLARHTSLAHTPPRIRRRRTPPPPPPPPPEETDVKSKKTDVKSKKADVKSKKADVKSKKADVKSDDAPAGGAARKLSARSDDAGKKTSALRKSNAANTTDAADATTPGDKRKSTKNDGAAVSATKVVRPKRTPAHSGVPRPEKMKKMIIKMKLLK